MAHLIKCLPTGKRPEIEYPTPVYLKNNIKLGVAVHACNASTGETETERSLKLADEPSKPVVKLLIQ